MIGTPYVLVWSLDGWARTVRLVPSGDCTKRERQDMAASYGRAWGRSGGPYVLGVFPSHVAGGPS